MKSTAMRIFAFAFAILLLSTASGFSQDGSTRVFAQLFPEKSEKRLAVDFVVVQNNQDIGVLRYAGGGLISPGTYTFEVRSDFTPFQIKNVVIVGSRPQTLAFEVPIGWVEVKFTFHTPPKSKSRTAQIFRLGSNGKPMKDHISIQSGDRIPLVAGRYRMEATLSRGRFPPIDFEIQLGKPTVVTLRQN